MAKQDDLDRLHEELITGYASLRRAWIDGDYPGQALAVQMIAMHKKIIRLAHLTGNDPPDTSIPAEKRKPQENPTR